jgi:hypothetical protein
MGAKRIFASGAAAICLSLGTAGTAAADPGNSNGGPAGCFGPPGQTIVRLDKMLPKDQQFPPGQEVSFCAQLGGGGVSGS